jgi:hypothetical protein
VATHFCHGNQGGYYIAGQGVLCLIIGVLALVAYLLIGLPNALVLALVAGVLEAVPMVDRCGPSRGAGGPVMPLSWCGGRRHPCYPAG